MQNALVDEARGYFSRAFALDSRLAGALLNSANQLGEKGALDAAMVVYALIMELQPGYEIARENLARAHLNRGVATARIGALDKAILDFDKAMRLRPSPETVNLAKKNIAAAYTKLGIDHVAKKRCISFSLHFDWIPLIKLQPRISDSLLFVRQLGTALGLNFRRKERSGNLSDWASHILNVSTLMERHWLCSGTQAWLGAFCSALWKSIKLTNCPKEFWPFCL